MVTYEVQIITMDDDSIAKLLATIGVQKYDPLVITALSEYARSKSYIY